MSNSKQKIIIFDTTMRDGELTPGVTMNLSQKIEIAKLLESIKVDVIEVGYPGVNYKDIEEISVISQIIKESIICGLTGSNTKEITILGENIKNAVRGRINIFTNVNTTHQSKLKHQDILDKIAYSITLAKNYCDDIQWSAFDAVRSNFGFLIQGIEIAITNGAKTICIPDSFGSLEPHKFADFITKLFAQVKNIDSVIVAVHCHDNQDLAVANSLAAMEVGARQIECSVNGLGARKGNTNLKKLALKLSNYQDCLVSLELNSVATVSQSVKEILALT